MFNEETISSIFKGMFTEIIAKRKLEKGEELTEEEKDELLQQIYASTIEKLREYKKTNTTKAKVCLKAASILSFLGGEKLKGYKFAMTAAGTGIKDNIDNYKRVLIGVNTTAANQTSHNFTTLLEQYEKTEAYSVALAKLMVGIQEVNDSYKKDFQSPIAQEAQAELKDTRSRILELSSQYETKRKTR